MNPEDRALLKAEGRYGYFHGYAEMADFMHHGAAIVGAPSWGPKINSEQFIGDYVRGAFDALGAANGCGPSSQEFLERQLAAIRAEG